MNNNKYYRYQLTYPIEGTKIYKSKKLSNIVKKCYNEYKKNNDIHEGLFCITNIDKGIEYQFGVKNRKIKKQSGGEYNEIENDLKFIENKTESKNNNPEINILVDNINYIKDNIDIIKNQLSSQSITNNKKLPVENENVNIDIDKNNTDNENDNTDNENNNIDNENNNTDKDTTDNENDRDNIDNDKDNDDKSKLNGDGSLELNGDYVNKKLPKENTPKQINTTENADEKLQIKKKYMDLLDKQTKPALPKINDLSGSSQSEISNEKQNKTRLPREESDFLLRSRRIQEKAKNEYNTLNWTYLPKKKDDNEDVCIIM